MTVRKKASLITFVLAAVFFTAGGGRGGGGGGEAWAADAKLVYRYYCASCHGLEGKGDGQNATESQPVSPRDHTSAADMSKLSDEEIMEVIKNGGAATDISRMMPPFKD